MRRFDDLRIAIVGFLVLGSTSAATPTGTQNDIPRLDADGLLPTALFRRVYISYFDRLIRGKPLVVLIGAPRTANCTRVD